MGARHKLNQAYLNGSLLMAGAIGWAMESMTVFIVALGALVMLSLHSGDIRPNQRERRR